MTLEQTLITAILIVTIGLFLHGRWRHDMVAIAALLACVLFDLIPGNRAFAGFGHPAVITVACVLIMSHALQTSGAVDSLTRRLLPTDAGSMLSIAILTLVAGVLSGFMNNVGALALLLPVALRIAQRLEIPAGRVLMPVAFGSILGGMTTLIGTPPNLIVAGFRAETGQPGFAMFDFTPVGLAVALSGILFIVLGGWRLVPARERSSSDSFKTSPYLTEARITANSKAAGMSLYEIESALEEADAQIIGMIRNEQRLPGVNTARQARQGDILVIEAEPETLATALSSLGLELEANANADDDSDESDAGDNDEQEQESSPLESDDVQLIELAVLPDSRLAGHSITQIQLRNRFGINLLALSRQGERSMRRLRSITMNPGDVLLLQGAPDSIAEFAEAYNCVPLAERQLRLPGKSQAIKTALIMFAAIVLAATGIMPAVIAFALAVLLVMVFQIIPTRSLYESIDWPVIVLLGAMIPVAGAMATTGSADLFANVLLDSLGDGNPVMALVLILIITMMLSDFMNNAATAAVMCPVAISAANTLGTQPDPFLMAVAVGASCAFLTPVGHQNNTLILGPGGFHFGDYWRLGLPLEIIVITVSTPMILWIWPL